MNKYFVIDNENIAKVMEIILGERPYVYYDDDKNRYSFKRTSNINEIYGMANNIVNTLK